MANLQLSEEAAPTGGWTAFSTANMAPAGSALNGQVSNPTPTAPVATTNTAPTGISPAQAAQDQLLFSDRNSLTGQVLLNLATRYATSDITKSVNAAAGGKAISGRVMYWRINAAIKKHAKDTGRTVDEVTEDLTVAREAAGVRQNRPNRTSTTTADNNAEHTGDTTEEEEEDSEAESEDIAASSAPASAPSGSTAPLLATTQATTAQLAPILFVTPQHVNTPRPQDQAAFADPARLTGDAFLDIATRYATSDIAVNVNAAAGKQVMSRVVAISRLRRAITDYAARVGQTENQVKRELTAARKAAGVRCADHVSTHTEGDVQHTGNTNEEEEDSDADNEAFAPPPVTFTVAPVPPPAPILPTPANDLFLFSNPERLFGETFLTLAERYSNTEISNNIGQKPGTDKAIVTTSAVSRRLTRALESRAKATGITTEQARANLHTTRENNGVSVRAANGTVKDPAREPDNGKKAARNRKRKADSALQAGAAAEANNKKSKAEPAPQADVAIAPTAPIAPIATLADAVQEAIDAEMADVATETPVVAV